ncbi:hypothetical protein NDU88_008653 [Pleurodeles waltl]|uniref:Uncharacterized protein n=1 Tax=Pleurodeles waltl TaxID=8319 RepID=A0AAV7QSC4_PLEWA|nr:hypothetical protein NDU88_008653 [Pleurodeles waltl]
MFSQRRPCSVSRELPLVCSPLQDSLSRDDPQKQGNVRGFPQPTSPLLSAQSAHAEPRDIRASCNMTRCLFLYLYDKTVRRLSPGRAVSAQPGACTLRSATSRRQ